MLNFNPSQHRRIRILENSKKCNLIKDCLPIIRPVQSQVDSNLSEQNFAFLIRGIELNSGEYLRQNWTWNKFTFIVPLIPYCSLECMLNFGTNYFILLPNDWNFKDKSVAYYNSFFFLICYLALRDEHVVRKFDSSVQLRLSGPNGEKMRRWWKFQVSCFVLLIK